MAMAGAVAVMGIRLQLFSHGAASLRRTLLATAIVDVKKEACFWGIRLRYTRTKTVTTVGAGGAEGSRTTRKNPLSIRTQQSLAAELAGGPFRIKAI